MKSSLRKEQKDFIYGSYHYRYGLVAQARKTVSLTVSPDLSITLKYPNGMAHERIESFLKRKWIWLERQLQFFKKYQTKQYKKDYLSGESFLYLGRQYKLLIRRGAKDEVILGKKHLLVLTTRTVVNSRYTKSLVSAWYRHKMEKVFHARYNAMLERFECKKVPQLVIREMSKRWGSFLGSKKIILNPNLIHAPKECIDYVIVHELCHLVHKKHDKQFFKLLGSKYPRWGEIKDRLEMVGSQSLLIR